MPRCSIGLLINLSDNRTSLRACQPRKTYDPDIADVAELAAQSLSPKHFIDLCAFIINVDVLADLCGRHWLFVTTPPNSTHSCLRQKKQIQLIMSPYISVLLVEFL